MTSTPPPAYPHAGPLLMVDIPGPRLDADTAEHLRRHRIGAVCLFRKNIESEAQLRQLTRDLREVMGENALIAIDQEGGCVVRTLFLPFPPAAMSLGAADDEALCEAVGAATARGLRSLGINWNFAPVLDLNVNPLNPVISERSFGADPQRASELARAWLRGSLREGVAGCVKHFPGHGDTHQDSHLALPHVNKPLSVLEAEELVPFRACLDAPAFMTAHIVFEALDPERPATLSPVILEGLLRRQWGYPGVIITDSMGMQAIDGHYGRGPAAVMALQAGADMVMALGRRSVQEETLSAVAQALEEGHIENAEARLARLGDLARRYPSQDAGYPSEARSADSRLMHHAWGAGLTEHLNPRYPLPGERVSLVAPRNAPGEYVAETGVSGEEIAALLAQVYDLSVHLYDDPAEFSPADLEGAGFVIQATTSRRRAGPVLPWLKPDLHLALWNPFATLDVDAPALISYGYRPEALTAVLEVLRGERVPAGRLPVTVSNT
ncbi:beta-N-acetylhexosaminidase [Deinobacterium chartae]|uniref:Beta-N-acetylhexosaminidase n=1 Tax=Deinobacterium chartae TaxID=521158 RepID=A0A841I097_9DEIO|nr:beta-N-acetylhexosaminidase [Deinobacterium chartae]MBB6097859.1 beta-N-acetylhexosaminidase [Deinobacterium chartae]